MKNEKLSNKSTSSTPLNLKTLPDKTFWLQEYLNTINDNIIALGSVIEELRNKQLEIEEKLSSNKSVDVVEYKTKSINIPKKDKSSNKFAVDIQTGVIIADFLDGKISAKRATELLGYKSPQTFYNLLQKKGIDYSNRVKSRGHKTKKSKKDEPNYPKNWDSTLKSFLSGEIGCKEAASLCEISIATFYYYLKREGIDYSSRPNSKRGRKPKYLNNNYGYPELVETKIACEDIDFDTWRGKLVTLIDTYAKKEKIKFSTAMDIIFKEGTKRYGIVWDEIRKNFNKEYERGGSSLEYAYFDKDARSIVYAIAVNKNEELNKRQVVNK